MAEASSESEDDVGNFLITGADATASIIAKQITRAADVFEHQKPEDLAFDEMQDITELSHQQLGQFMQFFTNMQCYSLQEAASADLHAQAAKTRLNVLQRQYYLMNDDDKKPKYLIEAEAASDPEIVKAEDASFAAKALNKMMSAQVLALEHKVALFSREISRRSADQSAGTRAN